MASAPQRRRLGEKSVAELIYLGACLPAPPPAPQPRRHPPQQQGNINEEGEEEVGYRCIYRYTSMHHAQCRKI